MLFEGSLKVRDIPKKWRQLMQMYVGKRPLKMLMVHSRHSLGKWIVWIFSNLCIGSAYAAQIYHAMNEEIMLIVRLRIIIFV